MSEPEIYLDLKVVTGLRIKYKSKDFDLLKIVAKNPWTGDIHKGKIKEQEEFHVNIHYPTPWEIYLKDERHTTLSQITVDYKGVDVGLRFATEALGDTLAWIPVVEAWMLKVQPRVVYVYTKWNHLFDKSRYPSNLVFIDDPEEFKHIPLQLFHVVGISRIHENLQDTSCNHATPTNWKDTNMIDTQNYSFGLALEERKPKLTPLTEERPIKEKYVTLCIGSSQKIKHWLNPKGWIALIRECKRRGYNVVTVGNFPNILPEVIEGNIDDIHRTMHLIKHAEFHIGLSSGLSWMAWAYNKPVLMIGDFTSPFYEFSTNIIRMYTNNEQAGVFNRSDIQWEPVWQYDPFKDNLQIARRPSAEHAIICLKSLIDKLGSDFEGVYITPDGIEHEIKPLRPKIVPIPYRD
jgi:autotransporter strand-loop-strand O-heptosyltransferase